MTSDGLQRFGWLGPTACGISFRARQRKMIAGAREGHVKQTLLLLLMIGTGGSRQKSIRRWASNSGPFQGEYAGSEHWQMDDLEFKTLAAVHGHETHGIDTLHRRRGFAQRALIAKHLEPTHPAKQAPL